MGKNIIEVEHLSMAYDDKPVLWDAHIGIVENSRTAIIGPNGAGKTTLLKGILNIHPKLSGEVYIMGKSIRDVKREIAYIPQSNSVNWNFPARVIDVVLMGRYVHLGWIKRPKKRDYEIAEESLEKINMLEYKDRQISQLSEGQKQRVFIARAIAQKAAIYFMDEPLAGVDKKTEKVIMNFLKEIQREGGTSIVVHHDLNTIGEYFDHLVILNKSVVAQGKVSEVYNRENLERASMVVGDGID
ncbi:metal ABC transporter ATP-binding protein [Anaerosphaera multitolerans]|uniref:Metal ABC transporter ATP-binding protein n=1 Tax=Anaerosphaera multitolerans TaxID=2487351 RepID=A0A437S5H2_9FIRM|nr:metal ABC transporter ATP-binding protein [Anaerosphaera multitolerans]RVU54261.1 metal ABC transporter ATP-binding protein [Anaerosphaera multitolerans]